MKNINDRILKGLNSWNERANQLNQDFKTDLSNTRYFQIEKLNYLEALLNKCKKDVTGDERISMNLLKGQIKDFERRLYPRLVDRIVRRVGKKIRNYMDHRAAAKQVTEDLKKQKLVPANKESSPNLFMNNTVQTQNKENKETVKNAIGKKEHGAGQRAVDTYRKNLVQKNNFKVSKPRHRLRYKS